MLSLLCVWCLSLNEGKLGSWAHVISRLLWQMRARPVCLVHDRRCVGRRNEVAHLGVRLYISILCSGIDCRLFWYLYTHPIGMLYMFWCLDAALKNRFPHYHPLALEPSSGGSSSRAPAVGEGCSGGGQITGGACAQQIGEGAPCCSGRLVFARAVGLVGS
jgi:hypothetical protein